MRLLRRKVWLLIPIVLLLVPAGGAAWALAIPAPMPEAYSAMEPGGGISVETTPWLVFQPSDSVSKAGLVFYPGGRVDYRAYAPAARSIAEQGYLVVIPRMPLNLAVLAPNTALEVQMAFPKVEHWVVGGHSLGGAMAAQFTEQHPELVEGLVLWAAYPPEGTDLMEQNLLAASIYGSLDGVASQARILSSAEQLPPMTRWIEIPGGNHAQFGWYGPQAGDNEARISRADQQAHAIAATAELLKAIANPH